MSRDRGLRRSGDPCRHSPTSSLAGQRLPFLAACASRLPEPDARGRLEVGGSLPASAAPGELLKLCLASFGVDEIHGGHHGAGEMQDKCSP
jgi:hypothetical protein